MQLNHVALTVRDRARSRAFYADYFGVIDAVHDDDHLLILEAPGGGLLALREGLPPEDLGQVHFGFLVPDPSEVLSLRARFAEASIQEIEFEESGTFTRVQVFDPDGYRVEVYSM